MAGRDERGRRIDNWNSRARFQSNPGFFRSLKGIAPAFPVRLKCFVNGIGYCLFDTVGVPETNFALCRVHVHIDRFRIHLQE